MNDIVLSTKALNKKFGSLVVANNIDLALPRGARYALIGPNGAGKTTLINLLTGMLRPDSGHIYLGGDDITSLAPDTRVKRGLVRTFQINTLFPNLSALESVTLAVLERRGDANNWRRSLPSYKDAIDEAYGILQTLLLGDDCERPTRQLAYGQQRLLEIALALASQPKVLLLDEPAAGVPKDESGELFKAVTSISSDISVLFIEHDMDVVFRFATRIIVMVSGGILVEGTPAEIASDQRVREVSIWGRTMAEPILELRGVRAGYGDSVVLDDISFELPENGSLALLGRNGVGKSTTFLTIICSSALRRMMVVA